LNHEREASFRLPARGGAPAIAAGVGLVVALCAAVAPLAAQRLPFSRFAAEQGISGSQIWDVLQDRRGLVWVATTWGFSRFDGERFSSFSVAEGLASPSGRSVLEDPDGNLWFGNNSGVARYDGRAIESFAGRPGAPGSTVWDAAVDPAGRLWFGSETGLSRFARGEFRAFGAADGLASDYVYALLAARDGALWVGSRGDGVARCELDAAGALARCRVFTVADGLASNVVRALAEDREGRILIGTRGGGLGIWEAGRMRTFRAADGLPSDDVYALLVQSNGHLVVGTAEHGLAICFAPERGQCRILGESNGLPEDAVRALHEDRDGNLWVGTEGGLGLLVREDLWNFSTAEGLPDRNVYAVSAGSAHDLWLGTFEGLAHLELGAHGQPSVEVWRRADGLPADWVWALLRDRHDALWVGTEGGLCRFANRRCTTYLASDGLPSSFVLALAEDAEGSIWVGTAEGVGRLRRDAAGRVAGVDAFSSADGLDKSRAYAIVADAAGRVWLAQGDRLTVYERGRFRTVGSAEGLDWRAVRGLGLDRSGRLLVGGWGKVARLESAADAPARFRVWDRGAGLRDQMVLTLAEETDGHLLLGTNLGIAVVDPEAQGGHGAVVARIDASSGAVATEVSHTAAFASDAAGRRWFGFKGGLTGILGELMPDPAPPSVAFARLESEGGRVFLAPFSGLERGPVGRLGGPAPELPHTDNRVRASVRATAYSRRGDLRFQFRLEGADRDWSDPRPEPFRDLMNLRPGEHRLLARAARADGPWGEPVALEFRIDPAWWQEPVFPYFAAIGLVFLGVAVAGWRARGVRRLTGQLERRIAERTDDIARYAAALAEHLQTVDRASDRARQAEQARRDLFARASHELRTPLTAVLGFSELLERALGARLEAKERRYLANVRESSELLLRQINELLEHLKLESGRVEIHLDEAAPDSIVESVASLMEGFALHRGVRLEVRLPAGLPLVRVDVAKLRQVLMNLVSNAVKFSPSGEVVEIEVAERAPETTGWGGAGYEIAVHDHGPGIPNAEIETIFEPYRRLAGVAATTPGTGLGLPIARQFVELLGGRLEVESEPGRGATFRVLLPVDPDPVVPLFETSDSGAFEPRRMQILVLDRDRERFSTLVGGFAEEELLAVRVDDVPALGRMLGSLRPRAVVAPFDPAAADGWWTIAHALRLVREHRLPFVVMPIVGARALALPFVGVLAPGDEEAEMRRALRAAGVSARRTARRPLALIAGSREVGIEIGAGLAAAGCDHFRVEGEAAVRAALAEAAPDVVATDVVHALALAVEIARRTGPDDERTPGWILFEAGAPERAELAMLAERVLGEGDEAERVLGPALARLLERSGAAAGLA